MDIVFFILTDISYILSFGNYLKNCDKKGYFFLITGILLHAGAIISRGVLLGYPPFYGFYDILNFLCFSIILLAVITGFSKITKKAVPLFALVFIGFIFLLNPGVRELPEQLKSFFFPLHVSSIILSYGAFFLSFICGLIYLFTGKANYDRVIVRAVVIGEIMFTLGIILGSVWAKQAWGSYWSWDPKETAALISWIIYAMWLFTRFVLHWDGKRSAWLAVTGFCAVIFTWFGVNYFFIGLHSYK